MVESCLLDHFLLLAFMGIFDFDEDPIPLITQANENA